jgi:hypothetical protein
MDTFLYIAGYGYVKPHQLPWDYILLLIIAIPFLLFLFHAKTLLLETGWIVRTSQGCIPNMFRISYSLRAWVTGGTTTSHHIVRSVILLIVSGLWQFIFYISTIHLSTIMNFRYEFLNLGSVAGFLAYVFISAAIVAFTVIYFYVLLPLHLSFVY